MVILAVGERTAYNKIYLLRRCGAVAPRVLGLRWPEMR